jgi:'Cold-shock' DNA-binding domain
VAASTGLRTGACAGRLGTVDEGLPFQKKGRYAMTGKIQTIRVDKGFGFIKDEKGKEYFFHRSAVMAKASRI